MARTVTMIATTVSAPQWDFAVSLALLTPSAAAAEALALAEERAEDADEEPRERDMEASLEAEERKDFREAEDTIFEIGSGAWRYWVL
jgi:hypothetical protein